MFAKLVLFSWPLVSLYLFRRLPLQNALVWSVVLGYLLLPRITGFDLPFVPPVDKGLMINVTAMIMCLAFVQAGNQALQRSRVRSRALPNRLPPAPDTSEAFVVRRGQLFFLTLVSVLLCASIFTVIDNREPIFAGLKFYPGLRMHDTFSITVSVFIGILPFLLARRYLASAESHVIILQVLVISCLFYTLPALWEIRMSPQLNKQIYGFGPHVFAQSVRGDGYRPIVFMGHGLLLAIFFALASMAAMALWKARAQVPDRLKWLIASLYILVVLILCKSMGALVILLLLLPVIVLFGVGLQLFIAAIIAATVLVYPMLRGGGVIPTQAIHQAVNSISPERAHSLEFRFRNEDELLAHANKKPLTGWGSWGRNRATNEDGKGRVATDGLWIITVGVFGWVGYIAQFGLLGISIILLAIQRHRLKLTPATSGLAVVMAGSLIDLIPNASLTPITWLIAGALMGRYQTAERVVKEKNLRKIAAQQTAQQPEEQDSETDAPPVAARRREPERAERPLHQRRPREG